MKPLTKSQQKVYDFILECAGDSRVPSVREICVATGLKSTSTVHLHLKSLEEKGLIEREKGFNRCIKLSKTEKSTQVPVLGRVTAGVPILAVENQEGTMPWHESGCFALRVRGDSMINARIFDGDMLFVKSQSTVDNGDIAVVLIDDEATVKRVYIDYNDDNTIFCQMFSVAKNNTSNITNT